MSLLECAVQVSRVTNTSLDYVLRAWNKDISLSRSLDGTVFSLNAMAKRKWALEK